jgi:capsule polysaccharide export protein KpsE/RkpR
MQQRDYILNEARKLALILARLMGLKVEGREEDYLQYFNSTLQDEYSTELEGLLNLPDEVFTDELKKANYSSEKLNALGQMLYMFAEPFEANEDTAAILKKVMIIFDLLETQHHFESFENLNKRNAIYSFFNTNYERT